MRKHVTPPPLPGVPPQGTAEWHRSRAGKCTASRFNDLSQNKAKTGWGVGAISYVYELVGERLALDNPDWKPPPELSTAPIKWGKDHEEFARGSYQWVTGNKIAVYGFVQHPSHEGIGASPDSIIADQNGILEIKCPFTTREHVRTLVTREVPSQYVSQVQGNLWVTKRDWCDFVSFDPRLHEKHTLCVVRVYRDEPYIKSLEEKVVKFVAYVDKIERQVRCGV